MFHLQDLELNEKMAGSRDRTRDCLNFVQALIVNTELG